MLDLAFDDLNEPRLAAFLEGRYRERLAMIRISPLTNDASTRRYFRIIDGVERAIAAVYSEPFDAHEMPFFSVRDLLASCGLAVPDIREFDGARGVMLLEDLGDETLQALVSSQDMTRASALYDEALDDLVRLQREAAIAVKSASCFQVAFDVEKLSWELHYFEKHFLEGLLGRDLSTEDRTTLAESFHALSGEIASWPRVLCHRDYHSRNIMRHNGRLYWLDFQDARMGPAYYDLASILRDSYVALPEDLIDEHVEAFRRKTAPDERRDDFLRRFELMCIQRNLKALGTFGYMASVRGSDVYLQYVPRTLGYVRRNLMRRSELDALWRALARHVEELS
ncbi:MAG: phosphotransferase, partial [Vicinamibacteria bacterium]|nr:phosphotransferase [Vicinamibacteria bacterium]